MGTDYGTQQRGREPECRRGRRRRHCEHWGTVGAYLRRNQRLEKKMLLDEFKIVEVAAIVLRDAQGRVLSVRKGSSPRFQMPGGKLEAHETPLEAALREVREEVGLDLKNAAIRPLGDFSAPASNEPGFTVVSHVFIAEGIFSPQQVRPHAEIAEVDWFDPSAPTTRPQAPLQAKIFAAVAQL